MSPKRLNRKVATFGTEGYAREELRAEIASAFLCQQLGVPQAASLFESHSSYLASWASVLRSDPQEIIKAASDAQKIADYLIGHALKPEVKAEAKSTTDNAISPVEAVPVNVMAEAANQDAPKRRRYAARM